MDEKLNKPLWKKMQRCWDNDMYVVLHPKDKGPKPKVKLSIDIKGDHKYGDKLYVQNTKELEDKIKDCYLWIYDNYKGRFTK
tara:strand:- start:627 stop:872 length:246 start_codon:yes stop_codon:yes gene_type:complete